MHRLLGNTISNSRTQDLTAKSLLICRNNGTLVPAKPTSPAHCACTQQYTGFTCDLDKRLCSSLLCNDNGECSLSRTAKTIECICETPWKGELDLLKL